MAEPSNPVTPRPGEGAHAVDPHEVRQETMIAMLERERRSLTSSLLALSILAASFAFYSAPGLFFGLLALRLLSFLITRNAARHLLDSVRHKRDPFWPQALMVVSMAFTGVTLGLLLVPPPPGSPFGATLMARATVLIAVTLIAVTLAAMRAPRDAMLLSFCGTVCASLWVFPEVAEPAIALVAVLVVIGIRVYSENAGHHIVAAARVLVENRQLSEDLAEALAHAEYLSARDPLTGLFNRRKLFEQRENAARGGQRQILTIDLDRFKAINDRFGHSAGDRVLVATADLIREQIWNLDGDEHLGFRLGGEEFLIILDQIDSDQARSFAEGLREKIAALSERENGLEAATITASIGIARWYPGEELDEALQRSDLACYEAKHAGRNQVRAAA
ncbi:GGDEF domain-containing protein [Qipengyuania vesicularis]|uniref:GGDEF domain-containing protein n=1 Tax=Qipengyuania vesicularis TaxID=2867232 RepID=UPI001C87432C|nr:GGDEF domain-containing protein [Qipengyuania vesicularis]